MSAVVVSVSRPSDVRGSKWGNKKVVFRDVTADTGDYSSGGFTLTAAQLGLSKHVDFCSVGSAATTGTSGATASVVGVTYVSSGTSVKFQLYESGGTDAPMNEKTAEAVASNFTFRVMAVGN